MSQTTVNPYEEIGAQIAPGLNYIISHLPAGTTPTIDNLVDAVYNYIQPIFYPATGGATVPLQLEIELKSVARNAINSYVNSVVLSGLALYDAIQAPLIQLLIGSAITSNLPINSIANRIADIEDNITDSGLSVSQQQPLLLTTTIGTNANAYWVSQVNNPQSAWNRYFVSTTQPVENYINIPFWDQAAMNGALSGYGSTPKGLIAPTIDIVTTTMVSALIGALTVTAGKVIFNWIPRINKPLSLNSRSISSLGAAFGTVIGAPISTIPEQCGGTAQSVCIACFSGQPVCYQTEAPTCGSCGGVCQTQQQTCHGLKSCAGGTICQLSNNPPCFTMNGGPAQSCPCINTIVQSCNAINCSC